MLPNLSIMLIADLHKLFLTESKHFIDGRSKGLPFDDLKEIRISLRKITEEIDSRNKL